MGKTRREQQAEGGMSGLTGRHVGERAVSQRWFNPR